MTWGFPEGVSTSLFRGWKTTQLTLVWAINEEPTWSNLCLLLWCVGESWFNTIHWYYRLITLKVNCQSKQQHASCHFVKSLLVLFLFLNTHPAKKRGLCCCLAGFGSSMVGLLVRWLVHVLGHVGAWPREFKLNYLFRFALLFVKQVLCMQPYIRTGMHTLHTTICRIIHIVHKLHLLLTCIDTYTHKYIDTEIHWIALIHT